MINETLDDSLTIKPLTESTTSPVDSLEIKHIIAEDLKSFLTPLNTLSPDEQFRLIKHSLADNPIVNEAQVLYFRAEISLKQYKIIPDVIAKKLIDLT